MDQTASFYQLTPERVLEAVESTAVRCTGRVLALNSMENRVFEVEIEVGNEAELKSRYDSFRVVKFYRPGRWTKEQILEEHGFLKELKAQDLPVVAPLACNEDGSTIRFCEKSGIWFAVFPRVGGRNLDELGDAQLERLGRMMARVHMIGAARKSKHRLSLDTQTYGRADEEFLRSCGLLPQEIAARYSQLVSSICAMYDERARGIALQRIHGDLHCGNILWDRDNCLLVDFDDSVNGPCVQDLWLLIPGRDEESQRKWERLLAGYEQMRSFNRNELWLVEGLRALRIVHFNAWIAKRWEDPAFKRVFVDFGSMKYWREQLIALEEQLQIMQGGLY